MAVATSTALAIASVTATVASVGISVYGAQQQKKTAKRTAEFNAKVAENEAIRVDQETRESIRRQRTENKRLKARQRAKIASSGVLETGTPLEVMGETAANLELGLLDQARAGKTRQSQLISQAGLIRAGGRAQADAANIQAGATLLNGASSIAGQSINFQQQGVL